MVLSIIKSSWYFLTYLFLFFGFYMFKKNDSKFNGISWLSVTAFLIMCFNTFIAGILSFVAIPVNILTLSFFNLLVGFILWYKTIKSKQRQQYYFHVVDFIAVCLMAALVIFITYKQFGSDFYINYETSDPAVHLKLAMDVFNTDKVSGMYFSPLNNAILIELLSPVTTVFYYYKLFIVADTFMLLLAGTMFFAAVRRYLTKPFLQGFGIFLTLAYLFGYPLNNEVYGFVYLGTSVSIIALLVFLCDCLVHEELNRWFTAVLLGLGCLSILVCYTLFAPAIYVGVFLCLCLYLLKQKTLFKLKSLLLLCTVFLIPFIMGIYYSYFGMFNSSSGLSLPEVLTWEGGIYRDLYSNFVIFLPFTIYGLIKLIQSKVPNAGATSFVAMLLFSGVLLLAGIYGKVSSYYYYKVYYALWFYVFYLLFYGIYRLADHAKLLITSYTVVWAIIAALNFSSIEYKLTVNKPAFVLSVKSATFLEIYNFNRFKIIEPTIYNPSQIEMFKYAYDNLMTGNNPRVPFYGYYADVYWFEAITNQRLTDAYWWDQDVAVLVGKMQSGMYGHYVLVQKHPDAQFALDQFAGYPVVYENDFGLIYSVPKI